MYEEKRYSSFAEYLQRERAMEKQSKFILNALRGATMPARAFMNGNKFLRPVYEAAKHGTGKWFLDGWGRMLSGVGRRLGGNFKFDPNTGKAIWQGAKTGFGNRIAQAGNAMTTQAAKLQQPWKTRLGNIKNTHGAFASNALRYGVGAAPLGLMATGSGDGLLSYPGKLMNTAYGFSPLGVAMNTMNGAANLGKNAIIDGAESISQQTLQEVAKGIRQQGRLAHAYGAFDPDGFNKQLVQSGMSSIKDKFNNIRKA